MWVMGGDYGGDRVGQNDVWHSSDGLKWTSATLHAAWPVRYRHTSVVHNGKMWVLGGLYRDNAEDMYRNDVWYSSDGVRWTSATLATPFDLGHIHTSVVYDGKIWVISIYGVWNSTNGTTWTPVTAAPPWNPNRYCIGLQKATVCDGKMWVMGGEGLLWPDSSVWYSTDGKNWTCATLRAPWPGRIDFGLVVFNRKMWILGGYSPGLKGTQGILRNDVWYSSHARRCASLEVLPIDPLVRPNLVDTGTILNQAL
jgi:hypothetical protein